MQMHLGNTRTWLVLFVLFCAMTVAAVNLWTSTRLSAQAQEYVHCYEELQHPDGSIGYLGHPPMREDQQFQPDPGERHIETHCFASWAEAAAFITGGAVTLPADATQKDYERATLEYSAKIHAEQLKAQQ
jgi:hypothetical protein